MFRMNRCWRLCQWLALGAFTVAMAGCAPTTEREGGRPRTAELRRQDFRQPCQICKTRGHDRAGGGWL